MKSKNRNRLALGYFIFFMALFPILTPLIPNVQAQEELAEKIYVLNGDIIKNFKFDTFRGTEIESNRYAGGKLIFENEAQWKIAPEDIKLVYSATQGNRTYLYYKLAMRMKLNLLTNVRLSQACSTGVVEKDSSFSALRYRRYYWDEWKECKTKILGICVEYEWKGAWKLSQDSTTSIKYNHYDFGDIRSWNAQHNSFSGNLVMSFDIDDSPLPNNLVDDLGRPMTKKFDYIGVSSLIVESSERGKLSEDEPTIQTIQPSDFDDETAERKSWSGDSDKSRGGKNFDFNIRLFDAKLTNTFDEGILPQSPGSSLNPTLKDGSPLFDPMGTDQSQPDCKFTYNLGRLSPVVLEYSATMEYDKYDVKHKLSWLGSNYDEWSGTTGSGTARTKQVALHVQNRYIQPTLKAVMNVWTAYETEVLQTDLEDDTLTAPVEYYDNLIWTATVDGSGGVIHTEDRPGPLDWLEDLLNLEGLMGIIFAIIGIVMVIVILFLVVRLSRGGAKPKTQRVGIEVQQTAQPSQQYTQLAQELQSELGKLKKERKKIEEERKKLAKSRRRQEQQLF